MWVRSSSFCNKSTRAIESINPDETSAVFSSIFTFGFRSSRTMCSNIILQIMHSTKFILVEAHGQPESRLAADRFWVESLAPILCAKDAEKDGATYWLAERRKPGPARKLRAHI
jgi:hypothetical protein